MPWTPPGLISSDPFLYRIAEDAAGGKRNIPDAKPAAGLITPVVQLSETYPSSFLVYLTDK
jgi:hypothetical protein